MPMSNKPNVVWFWDIGIVIAVRLVQESRHLGEKTALLEVLLGILFLKNLVYFVN